ncbi:MAG: hypothetical protein HN576_09330 [Bacteriovoracaceae bacterium]|jgi:hypothetical protein|nr:hypothetical protein [Bacteriovoracaceae bacterium]
MTFSNLLLIFLRLFLLAEIICFGIIIPKFINLENRISFTYQNVLININKTTSKSLTKVNQELKYDLLRVKRIKANKLL